MISTFSTFLAKNNGQDFVLISVSNKPFTLLFDSLYVNDGNLTSFYNRIDGAKDLKVVKNYFKQNKYID